MVEIILYGSCARGDYSEESDIDIALFVKGSRAEAAKYSEGLDRIATVLAMKYFAVVNFVCLPYEEFMGEEAARLLEERFSIVLEKE